MSAYRLVFEHPSFARGYFNTVYYTVVAIVLAITLTTLCAYPLSKKYLPGRGFFMKMIMFTMFFGGGMIPSFLLIKTLGMYNTVWAVTLPGAISAWNVMMMMSFFQGIPEALEEAAEIDGLGRFGILIKIVIPLSMPIIATMVLFFAVGQWNNWFGPLIYFNQNEKYPITLFLRNILLSAQQLAATSKISAQDLMSKAENTPAESLKSAAIVLVSMPILILYPFVQKYFVKGVMIGSLKQ
jgi:putative aldouronate transport system permease protein